MAQIKAQKTKWLDQAWLISIVIADLPNSPPRGLLSDGELCPPLTSTTKSAIEVLQDRISLHLSYRSWVTHKAKIQLPDGDAMFSINTRHPKDTLKNIALQIKVGIVFQEVDWWAIDAHLKLGRILLDRYVCTEWKRILPLTVASIGGQFTSQAATLKATQPRNIDRTSTLTKAVKRERKRDPFAKCAEVLDRLCGGDTVKELKDGRVFYWDEKGKPKDVGLDRFETIFSQQKPSTG